MASNDTTLIAIALVGVGAYLVYKQQTGAGGAPNQSGQSPLTNLLNNLFPTASANVAQNSAQTPPASTQEAIPIPAAPFVGTPSGCWPPDTVHIDDPNSIWGYSIAPIPAGASYCSATDALRAWLSGTVGSIPANSAAVPPVTTASTFIGPIQAPIQNVGP